MAQSDRDRANRPLRLGTCELERRFRTLRWDNPPSFARWRAEITATRNAGYGVDEGRYIAGVTVIAAPVIPRGRVSHALVVVGVLSSAIAAFFYIRVIVLMFFSEPKADGPTVAVPSALTMLTIAAGVVVTLVLGLAPQYFLDLANQASVFVR